MRLVCRPASLCYSFPMKIVIATGIYPPEIGGPAYYAKNLADALAAQGERVEVVTFGALKKLPTGVRHLAFFLRLIPHLIGADAVLALDTFSAAIPAVALARVLRIPAVIRTGGDFLWEQYIERTGDMVILPEFYANHRPFTGYERAVYALTRWAVRRATVVFSSAFQRDVWLSAYGIAPEQAPIIENAIAESFAPLPPEKRNFLWYVRGIRFKNEPVLREAFGKAKARVPDIELETGNLPQAELIEKIRRSYAVILPSISDISPNYILDAIRCGKPFILTKFSGLAERYGDLGLLCDPRSADDVADRIVELCDENVYARLSERIKAHPIERTYAQVAQDFLALFSRIMSV